MVYKNEVTLKEKRGHNPSNTMSNQKEVEYIGVIPGSHQLQFHMERSHTVMEAKKKFINMNSMATFKPHEPSIMQKNKRAKKPARLMSAKEGVKSQRHPNISQIGVPSPTSCSMMFDHASRATNTQMVNFYGNDSREDLELTDRQYS